MPQLGSQETEADGSIVEIITDAGTGEVVVRQLLPFHVQPAAVRRRDEARGAVADWHLLRELHDTLTAGGQAYWNTIAVDAGLPATAGAYSTAMTFLTARRDKAMSRAVAALNRWRLA